MSLFRRISSIILGTSEDKLVKAKKEAAYRAEKALHPNEARAVEQLVDSYYEKALGQIMYTIGNTLKHHAKLNRADHIKNSEFMQRFNDDYGYRYFINGVSLGHQIQAGTADNNFQKEISILMEAIHKEMMVDANESFSSYKVAECFSAGAKVAADLGVKAGVEIYNQGYIAINDL